jgi:hypothetical protein
MSTTCAVRDAGPAEHKLCAARHCRDVVVIVGGSRSTTTTTTTLDGRTNMADRLDGDRGLCGSAEIKYSGSSARQWFREPRSEAMPVSSAQGPALALRWMAR